MGLGINSAIVGEIRPWAGKWSGAAEPIAGWLVCDGTAYSTSTRPELTKLFSIIGISYGGTGASSFNVPNMVNRLPTGGDTTGSYANTNTPRSSTLTPTHQLSAAEIPRHSHTATTNSVTHAQHGPFNTSNVSAFHTHQWAWKLITVQSGFDNPKYYLVDAGGAAVDIATSAESADHTHSFSTASGGSHSHTSTFSAAGGGLGHENMPPYAKVVFLIKY